MEFLTILEEFISEIGGKDAIKLLKILKENDNISEFDLAEDLKLNINQVRNILYKLNARNLVYSTRKKDREKGWYIYYWTFNFTHSRDLLKSNKEKELERLSIELEKEKDQKYYSCPNGCVRWELEEALENNYTCPECESILKQEDSAKKINEIDLKIIKINQELEELNKPLEIKREVKVEAKKKVSKKKSVKSKKHKKVKKGKKKGKKVIKKKVKKSKKKVKKTSTKKNKRKK